MYADLAELVADYLPEMRSDAEIAAVGRILEAVSVQIDSYCDRPRGYFEPASDTATTRIFRGSSKPYMQIPVHVGEVSTVTGSEFGQSFDATYWLHRGGWLYRSYLNGSLNGSPFQVWSRDVEYTVTARWGYAETPADIKEAARQLTVHYFERSKGTIGQINPNGFVIERDMPLSVVTLLSPYVRLEFEIT